VKIADEIEETHVLQAAKRLDTLDADMRPLICFGEVDRSFFAKCVLNAQINSVRTSDMLKLWRLKGLFDYVRLSFCKTARDVPGTDGSTNFQGGDSGSELEVYNVFLLVCASCCTFFLATETAVKVFRHIQISPSFTLKGRLHDE